MAREKNPAKEEDFLTSLRREWEEFDRTHPILDTRYYVEEWRKEVTFSNGWDQPIPSRLMRRFGPFTEEEKDDFLGKWEPDKGCHFLPRVENLRHYCYDKWGR